MYLIILNLNMSNPTLIQHQISLNFSIKEYQIHLELMVIFAFITDHVLCKTLRNIYSNINELRYTIFNEIYFKLKNKCPHFIQTTSLQQYNNHNRITV